MLLGVQLLALSLTQLPVELIQLGILILLLQLPLLRPPTEDAGLVLLLVSIFNFCSIIE